MIAFTVYFVAYTVFTFPLFRDTDTEIADIINYNTYRPNLKKLETVKI